jgi:hypothetical protein
MEENYYRCAVCAENVLFSSFYRHILSHCKSLKRSEYKTKIDCKKCGKHIAPSSLYNHYKKIHKIRKKEEKNDEKEEKDDEEEDNEKEEKEEDGDDKKEGKATAEMKLEKGEQLYKFFKVSEKKYFGDMSKDEMIKIIDSQINYYITIKNKLIKMKNLEDFNETPIFMYRHVLCPASKKKKNQEMKIPKMTKIQV